MADDQTREEFLAELRVLVDDLDEETAAAVVRVLVDTGVDVGDTDGESPHDTVYRVSQDRGNDVAVAGLLVLLTDILTDVILEAASGAVLDAVLDELFGA